MTRNNNGNNNNNNNQRQGGKKKARNAGGARRVVVQRGNRQSSLTLDEARYAALLHDPCTAPLARPLYQTGGSGFMQRFETDFSVGGDAGSTCGALVFTPNSICGGYSPIANVTATNVSPVWYLAGGVGTASPASDLTDSHWNTQLPAACPGQLSLGSIAGASRPVAACLQVYWPGSELNRQGFVSLFRGAPGDLNPLSTAITVSALRAASPYVGRMPQDKVEIRWQPEEGDVSFSQVVATQSVAFGRITGGGVGCIGCTWSGLPAGVGVRVRLVAVYEWLPLITAATGAVLDGGTAEVARGSLNRVLAWLKSRSASWYLDRGREIAAFMQRSETMRQSLPWYDEL